MDYEQIANIIMKDGGITLRFEDGIECTFSVGKIECRTYMRIDVIQDGFEDSRMINDFVITKENIVELLITIFDADE